MSVLASASVTLASIRDVESVTRYYILSSSTAAAPSKPTEKPPGGNWTTTEPSYTTGSTNNLYFTDLTVFTDGAYSYSDVCLSSSYEAAKAAYGQAVVAAETAQTALAQSVEYIVGTQTAATAFWTGVTNDSELVAGKTIAYKLPQTSAENATLNLTLADGTTTGAKAVYYNNTRVGTHYPANTIIHMTYDGTNWRITNYNSDTQNRVRLQNVITAAGAISTSHIICGTESGYRDIAAGVSFDLSYPLLFAGTAIAAGATTGTRDNNFIQVNSVAATNNGTIASGAAGKTLYLKGTVSGNTFTIAGSPFMTTEVPSTEDGFIYLPLGLMYSASNIYFSSSDKLYAYMDGSFRELARGEASEASRTASDYLYETGTGDLIEAPDAPSSDAEAAAMNGFYTKIRSSGAGAGFDVYQGDGTSAGQKRVAHYGAEAVIGAEDGAHTTIGTGRMQFDDAAQNLMFMGRVNNTSGKALVSFAIPLDHFEEDNGSYVAEEAYDLTFPSQTVHSIVGLGYSEGDSVPDGTLTETTHYAVTVTDGMITRVTLTAAGMGVINDYIANYDPVAVVLVKFLTEDSVQAFALEKTDTDYVTPSSPSMGSTVPGDGSFAVAGGRAVGEDSVAMGGGVALGRRSFAFGYSSQTGYAFAEKEGEVRFKSDKMAVEGEFMTFCSEGELTGWSYNTGVVDSSNSKVSVYGIGDYVRIDGDIVTSAAVPSGTRLLNGLPLSLFAGRDYGYSGNPPRMRLYGKLEASTGLITGTNGTLQAIIIANQWTDAGQITLPGAGTYLVRFSFNMTDNKGTGQMTGRINSNEDTGSSSGGRRQRQSIYFSNSSKDLCLVVTSFITVTGSTTITCQLYSQFGASQPDNAKVCIQAFCLSGSTVQSEVAELTLMNMSDFDPSDTSKKACLLNNGRAIHSGSHIKFGLTYIRDSLWDGGYNG